MDLFKFTQWKHSACYWTVRFSILFNSNVCVELSFYYNAPRTDWLNQLFTLLNQPRDSSIELERSSVDALIQLFRIAGWHVYMWGQNSVKCWVKMPRGQGERGKASLQWKGLRGSGKKRLGVRLLAKGLKFNTQSPLIQMTPRAWQLITARRRSVTLRMSQRVRAEVKEQGCAWLLHSCSSFRVASPPGVRLKHKRKTITFP